MDSLRHLPPTTIGERILLERRRHGHSQSTLGKLAGVGQRSISKIETGQSRSLDSPTVARLARALHVTTDYLLGMDQPDEEVVPRTRHGRGVLLSRVAATPVLSATRKGQDASV
jgi:transcriptional regulator with XRE-family HTH domain